MADGTIRLAATIEPPTPVTGKARIYVDTADKHPKVKVDDGTVYDLSNVTAITGTPVNNQLAIWTSANGLEGDVNITWDGSELNITGDIAVSGTVDGVDIQTHADRHIVGGSDNVILSSQASGSSYGISAGWAYTHDNNASAHHVKYTDSDARSGVTGTALPGNLVLGNNEVNDVSYLKFGISVCVQFAFHEKSHFNIKLKIKLLLVFEC